MGHTQVYLRYQMSHLGYRMSHLGTGDALFLRLYKHPPIYGLGTFKSVTKISACQATSNEAMKPIRIPYALTRLARWLDRYCSLLSQSKKLRKAIYEKVLSVF